jgi:membrane protease YdiL (CAAX protease family)
VTVRLCVCSGKTPVFSWIYFAIAFVGIRRSGRVTWQEVVGAKWHSWQAIIRDLGMALGAFVTMAVIGNLSNLVLGPLQFDSDAFRSMVAQNTVEALAFLVAALTGGFVEEFVFRGYISNESKMALNLELGSGRVRETRPTAHRNGVPSLRHVKGGRLARC